MNSDFSDIAAQLTNSLAADGQTSMTGPIKAATGSAANPSYTFAADPDTGFYLASEDVIGVTINGTQVASITTGGIANGSGIAVGVPVGSITDFAGASVPSGWLLCFGQLVNTTTYAALFAVIGYAYGGSGVNFGIPDCRGRTGYGKDDMGGSAAGRITVFAGTLLGGTGGNESTTILLANLPSDSIPGSVTIVAGQGSHTHLLTNAANVVSAAGGGASTLGGASLAQANIAAATLPQMTGAFVLSLGADTPLTTISNGIIFNKIIFAGA